MITSPNTCLIPRVDFDLRCPNNDQFNRVKDALPRM